MSRTNSYRITALLPFLLAAALFVSGCDTSITLDLGTIRITVTATGNNIDADGYVMRVTGEGVDQERRVEPNGEVLFAVPSGRYVVELTDKEPNCIADLNPQAVEGSAGNTSDLLFNTLCG